MLRLRPSLLLVVGLAIASAAGCSAPARRSGPVAIGDFGATLEGAMCDWFERCTGETGCDLRLNGSAAMKSLAQAVAQGKIAYDPAAADTCIAIFDDASCSTGDLAARILPSGPDQPFPCQWAFRGTVAADAACSLDLECVSGACLIPTTCHDACCAGTCRGPDPAPGPGDLGQGCTAAGCVAGTACVDGLCLPPLLPAGSACQQDGACALGLICAGLPLTCREPVIAGAGCILEEGGGVRCGTVGVSCDDTKKCVQRPRPGVGEPCNGECAGGARCVTVTSSGMCVLPAANGAPCTIADECASLDCDAASHTCVDAPLCF